MFEGTDVVEQEAPAAAMEIEEAAVDCEEEAAIDCVAASVSESLTLGEPDRTRIPNTMATSASPPLNLSENRSLNDRFIPLEIVRRTGSTTHRKS